MVFGDEEGGGGDGDAVNTSTTKEHKGHKGNTKGHEGERGEGFIHRCHRFFKVTISRKVIS
jgi:hypothetical protein